MDPKNFFAELKRRNVYKVAVAYAVVGWLLVQVTTQVFPIFEIPNWALRLIVLAIIIGFPIALVVAWAFELTPEGIKHTEDVDLSDKRVSKNRTWIYVTLIGAALSVALFFVGRLSAPSSGASRTGPPEKSIAVLPFENAVHDADTEYLSDGIAEALINSLTELQQLKVIARSTAFRYKGKQIDPQGVGRELNVRTVLMGVVRQAGDRLNVQVDLVDAMTGGQLWGQEYERKLADVVAVKQALVRDVTEKLKLKLTGEQQQRLTLGDTTNPDAYQFYLRGRYYWNKRTAENLKRAMEQFQQAVDKDPNYALAYAGLSDCYSLLEGYAGTPANETWPKAKAFAERALQLDSSLAEAHTSLGYAYNGLWRWAEAEEEFKRAIKLNPNYPTAHHWYSLCLLDVGRVKEAKVEITRAYELDPLSLIIGITVTYPYLAEGDANFSIAQSKKVVDLDPNFPRGREYLGLSYLKDRRYAEAIPELEKGAELSGRERWPLRDLGYGYAISGKRAEAEAVIKELAGKYEKGQAIGQDLAAVYAGLGDKDQAFAWLEKDFQTRSGLLAWTRWTPAFESLRSDPRFTNLLRRMGFKP
jgi:TolB-like protein/Flp pilus assembly protein TadD